MTHVDDLYEPGDDREPVEPDEYEQQPVNLDEVEQRLERLKFLAPPFGMVAKRAELNGAADLHDLAALIGQEVWALIAEVRQARVVIAEFEALPTREEWAVTARREVAPSKTMPMIRRTAESAESAAKVSGGVLWVRRLTVGPWEPVDDAPF